MSQGKTACVHNTSESPGEKVLKPSENENGKILTEFGSPRPL